MDDESRMKKKPFKLAKGVSNIELFYDLIFVYCISVVTSVLHHPADGFFDIETYLLYFIDMMTILQIWFFTTYLQNRYGDGGALDNVCLFINMFLLFFMAGCVGEGWQWSFLTWNFVWGLILVDLLVHWGIKRFRYSNLDDDDKSIMNRTMGVLAIQAIIVFGAAFLPWESGSWVSLIGFAFGWLAFWRGRRLTDKPTRFDHLAERCALLVIVVFGETIVAIASYMEHDNLPFATLVFLLVVGLFLVYFFEHDYMLDHHHDSNGISYMLLTSWIVFAVANITVALEYLPEDDVLMLPKAVYVTGTLCLYLLTSFAVFRFNKPQFRASIPLIVSRLIACAIIILGGALMRYDPLVTLAIDTVVVWAELAHEWTLYHARVAITERAEELGYGEDATIEILDELLETPEGRKKLIEYERLAVQAARNDERNDR